MSVQINFNNFQIDVMNYKFENTDNNQSSNIDFNINNVTVSISDDKFNAKIFIAGNVKEISQNKDIIRNLNLSVSYYYSLFNVEDDDTFLEARNYLENYGINTSMVMYEELVKQITSIDYNDPIILNGFAMPGSIERE